MNKLDLQKIEDEFPRFYLKIESTICGSCRRYKIEMHHNLGIGDIVNLEVDQVYNNFAIKIKKGIIKDFLEFEDSCINTELMKILNKVIK